MTVHEWNASVVSTFLGREDHGIPTFYLRCDGESRTQSAGGIALGGANATGIDLLVKIIDALGASSWEDLPGTPIRVRSDGGRIRALGHFNRNQWVDIGDPSS